MSDSVGKISLDLEIQSDISKQISNVSNVIANNLKKSLNSSMKSTLENVNSSTKNTMKNITNNINSSIKKSMINIAKTMKNILSNIKMPKINIPKPTNFSTPKSIDINSNVSKRGPPSSDIENLKDIRMGKIQDLDIADRQIDNLRNKLKLLNEQLKNTFDAEGRNKLESTILSTESRMNSLINKSIKLGAEVTELDTKIDKLGKSANSTNASLNNTSNITNKATKGIKSLTNILGRSNNTSKSYSSGIGVIARSMLTWGIMFPMILRGLSTMATGLLNNLKTNEQFSNSLAQIKSNLMIAFTPIYEAILPAINTLMSALSIATQYIASFISAIFGKTFEQSKQATQGLIDAKAAMGAYGDSAKAAGEAAKDALGLASFDEINSLNSQNSSGSDSGGASGVPTLVTPSLDTAQVDSAMSELAEKVKRVFSTIFQPFKNAWAKDGASVVEQMKRAIEATKQTFINFYNVLATPPVQLFIENVARIGLSLIKLGLAIYTDFILPVINWFINLLPGAANGLNPILDAVRRFIDYLSSNTELLRLVISVILGVVAGFKTLSILIGVVKWIEGVTQVLSILAANPIILVIAGIAALVVAFMSLYASSEAFRNKVNEVCSAISGFLAPAFQLLKDTALDVWNNALVPLGAFLLDLWKTVLEPLAKIIGEVLVLAFKGVIEIIKTLWENVLKPLVSFFKDILIKTIQSVIDIYNAWKPAIQKIIDIILVLWNNVLKPLATFVGGIFLNVFKSVCSSIGEYINSVKQVFNGLINFITGVFTGNWSRAWQGVKDIFGGIMSGLGAVMKAPLNAVISLINGAISGLNKISVDIPDWVPSWAGGGKHFGVNIPSIPYLAKGGIIDSPTLAMVGEAGKEAVVPLENNTQGLDLLASKLMERLGGTSSNNNNSFGDGDLILQIDGSIIGKVALKQLRKMQRQGNITLIPV
ncbi:hypothetical protein ACQPUY_17030 [Clostridium nigeriense]|uniref:phage tail protein n=1 Tax=Clostridium nigeriense TaxID=1805470 RepID=UPI003D33941C